MVDELTISIQSFSKYTLFENRLKIFLTWVKYLLVALQRELTPPHLRQRAPPKSETRFIFVSIFFSSTWLIMNTICSHPQK